jgi:hypothetical protein
MQSNLFELLRRSSGGLLKASQWQIRVAHRLISALFYCQNVLEMVHRAKNQRRIVLKRTAAVDF